MVFNMRSMKNQKQDDATEAAPLEKMLTSQVQRQLDSEHAKEKAIEFVAKIRELLNDNDMKWQLEQCKDVPHISSMVSDGMVRQVEQLFACQQEFQREGKAVQVDLGYHYTRSSNLDSIRRHGLLTKLERDERTIRPSNENGFALGHGIYTCDNPFNTKNYGDVCLVVARLKGVVQGGHFRDNTSTADSIHTNTSWSVLRKSTQCLALMQISSSMFGHNKVDKDDWSCLFQTLERKLQEVVDDLMNDTSSILDPSGAKVEHSPQVRDLLQYLQRHEDHSLYLAAKRIVSGHAVGTRDEQSECIGLPSAMCKELQELLGGSKWKLACFYLNQRKEVTEKAAPRGISHATDFVFDPSALVVPPPMPSPQEPVETQEPDEETPAQSQQSGERMASIQVRFLWKGEGRVVQVGMERTVGELAAILSPEAEHDCFRLMTGFPPRPLTNPAQTVEEAGLQGAQVYMKKA